MMAPFPVAPSRSNNDHEVVSTTRTISDTNPFKNGSSFDVSKKLNRYSKVHSSFIFWNIALVFDSEKVRKSPNFSKMVENQEILKPLFLSLMSSLFFGDQFRVKKVAKTRVIF